MSLREHWTLGPSLTFLNHGSFGACPRAVLAEQRRIQDEEEANPMAFFAREIEARIDAARAPVAEFLGAAPADLAFVQNASTGVSSVIRSLPWAEGDEVLTTSHAYNAVRTTLDHALGRAGAKVVAAKLPFPVSSPDQVVEAVLAEVSERTRLAVLDHVTSSTGLVMPIERLVRELAARGVDTLVDGAHAPGMVDLDLGALGAAYYTGNCHKWLCAPKGAAILYVRADRQDRVKPLVVSHGANAPRDDRSRFHLLFDWLGTWDPSAYLAVPKALEVVGGLVPGGWAEVRQRNHDLVLTGRGILCEALGCEPAAPAEMIGSIASIHLPRHALLPAEPCLRSPLQQALLERGIEVAIFPFPARPDYLLRISAQLYNERADYERLAAALKELLV